MRNDLLILQGIAEMISLRANLLRIWLDLEDVLSSMTRNFDSFHSRLQKGAGTLSNKELAHEARLLIIDDGPVGSLSIRRLDEAARDHGGYPSTDIGLGAGKHQEP